MWERDGNVGDEIVWKCICYVEERECVLTAELTLSTAMEDKSAPESLSSLFHFAILPSVPSLSYASGLVLPTHRLRGTEFAVVPVAAVPVCSVAGCASLQVLQVWRYLHEALWHLPSFQLL